jgi:hypothetical protein
LSSDDVLHERHSKFLRMIYHAPTIGTGVVVGAILYQQAESYGFSDDEVLSFSVLLDCRGLLEIKRSDTNKNKVDLVQLTARGKRYVQDLK